MFTRASLSKLGVPSSVGLIVLILIYAYARSSPVISGRLVDTSKANVNSSALGIPTFGLHEALITESNVLKYSAVQNKYVAVWSEYRWRIIGVIAVILVEAALIALLLFERRQRWSATRHLTESKERYRDVVETQTELICRFLPDTTLTFVNDAYCRYFGKSRDELIGLKFIEMIPTDHQAAARRHIQSLIENPRTDTHEHEVVRPDGTIGWQQWINHVISGGDSIELQGIGRDITERHLALQAIQESEERFAKAFRSNPQPMSLTTLDEGKYLDVNESFLRMSGYTRGEVVGHTSAELRNFEFPEDRQRLLVQPLMKAGVLRNIEIRFRVKDGTLRTLLSSAELIELSGQKCILVASSDITERKESEHRLAELTGRLLKTQDEERRHIARELHDVTAQNIGLIMLNLAQVQSGAPAIDQKNQQRLTESLALGEQALKEIRTLSYVLHPPLLDQAGLVTALRWYVKGFSERSGVKVNFNESGNNGQRMPPDVEYALFRVVQECLTNIRRHTKSETAEIDLQRTARTILLTVHDHGTAHVQMPSGDDGIESLGVGIPGMRHRLKQLGGELSVDANVNGTMVTAMVPVRWVIHDSSTVGG
jgi:PAS domain S-box-containing protein